MNINIILLIIQALIGSQTFTLQNGDLLFQDSDCGEFCDAIEKADLKEIEKLIKQKVPVISDHPFAHEGVEQAPMEKKAPQQQRSRHSNSQKNRGGGSGNSNSGGNKRNWKQRR